MHHLHSRIAAAALCACGLQPGHAADVLYAYDGFDYAAGSLIAGQAGGKGWATAWGSGTVPGVATVVSGLGYTDAAGNVLQTQGGAARTSPDVFFGQLVRTPTESFGQPGSSVWVSYLVQQSANPAQGTSYAGAALGQGLTFGSSAMFGGLGATTAGVGAFYTTNTFQNGTTVVPANSVSFIVLRYDFSAAGNDTLSLWLNPVLNARLGAPAASGSFRDYPASFSGITLAHGDSRAFAFDELRIGSSFAAVTGVVPEPASVLLTLAGLGALAARRRAAAARVG